jgi:hypothetical protein
MSLRRYASMLVLVAHVGVFADVAAADAPPVATTASGESTANAGAGATFSLGASVVAGGGDAQGGVFSSSVTISQPVAEDLPMSGGVFEASTGFWPAVTAVPRADLVFASGFEAP